MMNTNDKIILDQILKQKQIAIASTIKPDEFFEIFTAEQILKDYDLSYEEIRTGITGKGGDGGIDSMYILINGELNQDDTEISNLKRNVNIELFIIQSKTSSSYSETAIDKLIVTSEEIFDLSMNTSIMEKNHNSNLAGMIVKFKKIYGELASKFPILNIHFFYVTKGSDIHPNVSSKKDRLVDKVKQYFSSNCNIDFTFLGSKELLSMVRREPKVVYSLNLAENPISSDGDVGFVCLVRLIEYYNFITDDSKNLLRNIFEANVRDYQGTTQVNGQIQTSLTHTQNEDFWWLNNGVTIIASQATLSGKTLRIENPEVVNGLQTSTEIHRYFTERNTLQDNRNLLVRIIVPKKNESRDRIIKATNSQTPIPEASLRATDKIHRDIEEYLRSHNLFYDRRKNYYKNEGRPIDKIISIPYLAQSVMAIVLQKPDSARARPSSLLKKDDDYKNLFSQDYPVRIYYVCATLVRSIEEFLRSSDIASGLEQKNKSDIKFHMSMYVSAMLANKLHPSKIELASLEVQTIDTGLLQSSVRSVLEIYESLGASNTVAKGPNFVTRIKQDLEEKLGRS